MSKIEIKELYKAFGVFWEVVENHRGSSYLGDTPFCGNDSCRSLLEQKNGEWFCVKCEKFYPCKKDYATDRKYARQMWEGYRRLDWDIYSLELPPTKVVGTDTDDNYWVTAKLGEKNGKRMAVIYFGEKINGKQDKADYSHLFIDIEDEQLRFDKGNKNPMKILCQLTVEFADSVIKQKRKNTKP